MNQLRRIAVPGRSSEGGRRFVIEPPPNGQVQHGKRRGRQGHSLKGVHCMRVHLMTAAALAAIAVPAVAKDGSGYVGVDGGALFPQKQTVAGSIDFTTTGVTDFARQDIASEKYKTGYDLDVV